MIEGPQKNPSTRPPKKRRWRGLLWVAVAILFQFYLWFGFLVQTNRVAAPTADVIQYTLGTVGWIIMVGVSFATRQAIWVVGSFLILAASQLTVNFSYLYWSNGSLSNFTTPLSHLDAVYFTLGTLSTSGTGNIEAISETSRRLQLLQNVLDIGLVLFAVSLFVARFAAAFGQDRN